MRGARHATRRALLKVTVLCALAGFGFYASQPRADAPDADIVLANGVFSQTNSRDALAILQTSGMRPGSVAQGTVTIANTGTLTGYFKLAKSNLVDEPGSGGGVLSGRLDLLVEDITGAPTTVYAGKLGAMADRSLGSFPAGQSRIYRFTVSFPAGAGENAFKGSKVTVQYDWHATDAAEEPPPVDPEPTPTPEPTPAPTPAPTPGPAPTPTPSPGPTPPLADTTPPALTLGGAAKQKASKKVVIVTATCNEGCSLTAAATASGVPKAATMRIAAVTAQGAAGGSTTLKLKLPAKLVAAVKKTKKGTVTVTVTASDGAGNTASATRKVKLTK